MIVATRAVLTVVVLTVEGAGVGDPRGVGQEHPECDRRAPPGNGGGEGQVVVDRVVEGEEPLVVELEEGGRGDRLRDRGEQEEVVVGEGQPLAEVGLAEEAGVFHLLAVEDQDRERRNMLALHLLCDALLELGDGLWIGPPAPARAQEKHQGEEQGEPRERSSHRDVCGEGSVLRAADQRTMRGAPACGCSRSRAGLGRAAERVAVPSLCRRVRALPLARASQSPGATGKEPHAAPSCGIPGVERDGPLRRARARRR